MSAGIVPGAGRRGGPVRAVAATAVLAGLLVGTPLLLLAAGGPWFVHPDVHALGRLLTSSAGSPAVVVHWLGRAALAVAWVAWAWLVVCVVVEVGAWRLGRSAVPLPAGRRLQSVVALLVGTALALSIAGRQSSGHLGVVGAGPGRPVAPTSLGDRPDPARVGGRSTSPTGRPLTVLELGPPPAGTTMRRAPAPDAVPPESAPGRAAAHRSGDTPTDGAAPSAPTPGARATGGRVHVVARRETLWAIAEDRLGAARRWREIAALNYGRRQPDGGSLGDDHWVRPGWTLRLPPGPDRPSSPPGTRSDRSGPVAAGARPVTAAPERPGPDGGRDPGGCRSVSDRPVPDEGRRGPHPLAVTPFGAGIVGVGLADLVERLRRVQQRHRPDGARLVLPSGPVRRFEQAVRLGARRDLAGAVEAAVHLLDRPPGSAPALPARVVGIGVSDEVVRVYLDGAVAGLAVAPPWTWDEGARTLVAETRTLRRALAGGGRRRAGPLPTLATVGGGGGEVLLVHLEGLGSVAVAGPPPATEGLVRSLALELATGQLPAARDLVLVGFGHELERFDRVEVREDAGVLADELAGRVLRTRELLDRRGWRSVDEARRLGERGAPDPVVVLCGPRVAADAASDLLRTAGDGRWGLAVVAVGGDGAARHVLTLTAEAAGHSLTALGSVLRPQLVSEADVSLAAELVAAAASPPAPDAPVGREPGTAPGPGAAVVSYGHTRSVTRAVPGHRRCAADRARPEVEVAVLGPVVVRGAAREFTRAWARELVVYLAVHPGGASNDAWATALWPDRVLAPSSLHSTASVARRALGRAADGTDHLPRSHGRLALGPSVGTDWEDFGELAATDEPARWREALELVRGRPFEGLRAADWVVLDGIGPAVEAAVVDVSGRLSGHCLRSGDARGAEWAARRGLLVSPYDERLYRMLLRAADLAGNPQGVEAVMAELVRVVADEIEPIESVHPSTLALYRSLSRRRAV